MFELTQLIRRPWSQAACVPLCALLLRRCLQRVSANFPNEPGRRPCGGLQSDRQGALGLLALKPTSNPIWLCPRGNPATAHQPHRAAWRTQDRAQGGLVPTVTCHADWELLRLTPVLHYRTPILDFWICSQQDLGRLWIKLGCIRRCTHSSGKE